MAGGVRPPLRSTGDFARSLHSAGSAARRLDRGVQLVVELLDACDHAGVTVWSRRQFSSAALSDDVVRRGDAWQYELDEGPCIDTVRHEHMVISQDLHLERRWTSWAPRVVDNLGISAMMSLPLYTDDESFGALNLYSDRVRVWNHRQIAVAQALAGHLAVAVVDAQEIESRGLAMLNRTSIGQAEGILMERFGISVDQAFAYLRRVSQAQNRKLITIAEEIVASRQLPDTDEAIHQAHGERGRMRPCPVPPGRVTRGGVTGQTGK